MASTNGIAEEIVVDARYPESFAMRLHLFLINRIVSLEFQVKSHDKRTIPG